MYGLCERWPNLGIADLKALCRHDYPLGMGVPHRTLLDTTSGAKALALNSAAIASQYTTLATGK